MMTKMMKKWTLPLSCSNQRERLHKTTTSYNLIPRSKTPADKITINKSLSNSNNKRETNSNRTNLNNSNNLNKNLVSNNNKIKEMAIARKTEERTRIRTRTRDNDEICMHVCVEFN